jgi:hypothetical protein
MSRSDGRQQIATGRTPTKPFAKSHKIHSVADVPSFGAHAVGKPTVTCPVLYMDHPSSQKQVSFPTAAIFLFYLKTFSFA